MLWMYRTFAIAGLVLTALALGFAAAWPRSRGRVWLIASLALSLSAALLFQIASLMTTRRPSGFATDPAAGVRLLGYMASLGGHVCLLVFAVAGADPAGKPPAAA